jgi:hypothetical protein
MKHLRNLSLLFAVCLLRPGPAEAVGVNYLSGHALGVPVRLVRVDPHLPNVRITPAVCPNFPRGQEDLAALIARTKPRAAITGTPIDVHLGRPPADLVIGGQTVNLGERGTAACFGEGGQIELQRIIPGAARNWWPYQAVLGGGPKLLTQGMIDIRPHDEGFHDPAELREATHTALGLTKEGFLLLVHVPEPVDLFQLAAMMKRLGCVEAMNLWSGEPCGLAYDGQILSDPGRPLTHALLVYDDLDAYAAAQPQLIPGPTEGPRLAQGSAPTGGVTTPPPTPREPPPPIRIVQPPTGTVVTEAIPVRAAVQPQQQRTYTVFYLDGEFRAASNVPPYEFRFDPRHVKPGEHTVEARLYTNNWELLAQDRITLTVAPAEEKKDG